MSSLSISAAPSTISTPPRPAVNNPTTVNQPTPTVATLAIAQPVRVDNLGEAASSSVLISVVERLTDPVNFGYRIAADMFLTYGLDPAKPKDQQHTYRWGYTLPKGIDLASDRAYALRCKEIVSELGPEDRAKVGRLLQDIDAKIIAHEKLASKWNEVSNYLNDKIAYERSFTGRIIKSIETGIFGIVRGDSKLESLVQELDQLVYENWVASGLLQNNQYYTYLNLQSSPIPLSVKVENQRVAYQRDDLSATFNLPIISRQA